MNQWSQRRKRIIFLIVLLVFVLLVGLPLFFLFYKVPTCFDGKMNGDETGIDCGGSCRLLCTAESLPLISRGDPRVLTVAEGVFEVVAMIENPNPTGVIENARYTIKLYDSSSTLPLKIIEGLTYIPKGKVFAVFEGPFNIDGNVPTRATLEWDESSLSWQSYNDSAPQIEIVDLNLSSRDTRPRIDANVRNTSLERISNIDLTVLVSNSQGNIFAASKTFVNSLSSGEEAPIVFTWPQPFQEEVSSTEVIVRILPDRSLLR